jgi:hypothetical protein
VAATHPSAARQSCFSELFAEFSDPAATLLDAAADIHVSTIEEIALDRWTHERVVLIGDAAHATSPNMAQGAAMGLEDARLTDRATGGANRGHKSVAFLVGLRSAAEATRTIILVPTCSYPTAALHAVPARRFGLLSRFRGARLERWLSNPQVEKRLRRLACR